MMEILKVPEFSLIENYASSMQESKVYNKRICARICELAEKFCADGTAEDMKSTLTQFYKEYGVGKFGLHKSFRITHDEEGVHIVPILNIAHEKTGGQHRGICEWKKGQQLSAVWRCGHR